MPTLTAAQRRSLPREDFAIPEKAPGPGSYPIHDRDHAIDALARVEHYGTPEEQAKVRRAVRKRYPDLGAAVHRHGSDVMVVDRTGERGHRIGGRGYQVRRRRDAT